MKTFLLKMLNALTSAYIQTDYERVRRDEPLETNIGKLFYILAWGLGAVKEQAELVKLWDDIDYAKGLVLDRYGLNYGVKRAGADDTMYRLMIKVKLLSQLSGGDVDTVLKAASFLFGVPVENLDIVEFTAKVSLDINEEEFDEKTTELSLAIAALLKRIVAAGVQLIFQRTVKSKLIISAIVVIYNAWPPLCGTLYCGTYWKPSTLGWTVYQVVITNFNAPGYAVSPEFTGTLPIPAAKGYSIACGLICAGNVGLQSVSPELTGTLPEVQHGT